MPPARSVRRLLLDPQVGPFFAGALTLATGLWAFNVTVAVLAFTLTGSSAFVGAITAAQFAAPLLLSLVAGKRADTADRLNQVLTGQLIGFSALVSLVLWGVLRGLNAPGTPQTLLVVAAVMGFGFSVSAPALQAVVPNLVHDTELQTAVTIHAASFNLGRALGPALAGVILVAGGPLWSFAVTTACYGLFIAALVRVRSVRMRPERVAGSARSRTSARQVLRDPSLRVHLVGVAITALVADPIITLAPAFAENLGVGSGWIGALGAAFGLGSAAVLLVAGRAQRRLGLMGASRLGLGCLALAVVGLGNWRHAGGAIALAFFAGAGFLLSQSSLTAAIQENALESQRGVTMALWTMAFLGSRPLSALLDGSAAEVWSPGVATLLVAAAGAAYAVRLRSRHEPVRRHVAVARE